MPDKKKICKDCGRAKVFIMCPTCCGKGTVQQALILKTTCETCNGEGGSWHCPDEAEHLRAYEKHPDQPAA